MKIHRTILRIIITIRVQKDLYCFLRKTMRLVHNIFRGSIKANLVVMTLVHIIFPRIRLEIRSIPRDITSSVNIKNVSGPQPITNVCN